jgi:hypothetical protein
MLDMAIWLYPIAKRAGKRFVLKGKTLSVSVANFEKLVRNGRLKEDRWWFLSANFLRVNEGDEVFVYSGDDDKGIIGYARVRTVDREDPALELRFDRERCVQLLKTPVPASLVRKWVFPRRAVVDLTPHLAKLNSLLPWRGGRVRKEAEEIMSRARGAGFSADSERIKQVELAAIRVVTKHYRDQGWSVDPTYQTKRLGFDLLCSKGSQVKKAEVKGVHGGDVSFIMTAGERRAAKDRDFVLHVVCNALSKPLIKTWSGREMERAFKFSEIQFQVLLKKV